MHKLLFSFFILMFSVSRIDAQVTNASNFWSKSKAYSYKIEVDNNIILNNDRVLLLGDCTTDQGFADKTVVSVSPGTPLSVEIPYSALVENGFYPLCLIQKSSNSVHLLCKKTTQAGSILCLRNIIRDSLQVLYKDDSLGIVPDNIDPQFIAVSDDNSKLAVIVPGLATGKALFSFTYSLIDLESKKIIFSNKYEQESESKNTKLKQVLVSNSGELYLLMTKGKKNAIFKENGKIKYEIIQIKSSEQIYPAVIFSQGEFIKNAKIYLCKNQDLFVFAVKDSLGKGLADGILVGRFNGLEAMQPLQEIVFPFSFWKYTYRGFSKNTNREKIEGLEVQQVIEYPNGDIALIACQFVTISSGGYYSAGGAGGAGTFHGGGSSSYQKSLVVARVDPIGNLKWAAAIPNSVLRNSPAWLAAPSEKDPSFYGSALVAGDSLLIAYIDHPKNLLVPETKQHIANCKNGKGAITLAVLDGKGSLSRSHLVTPKESKVVCYGENIFAINSLNAFLFLGKKGSKQWYQAWFFADTLLK